MVAEKNIRFFLTDFAFGIKKDCIFAPAKQSKREFFFKVGPVVQFG